MRAVRIHPTPPLPLHPPAIALPLPTPPNVESCSGIPSNPHSATMPLSLLPTRVLSTPKIIGWACPLCTFENLPHHRGCKACSGPPPLDYVVPEDGHFDPNEHYKPKVGGWVCPMCFFTNHPHRPGCETCTEPRPLNYAVPKDCSFDLTEYLPADRPLSQPARILPTPQAPPVARAPATSHPRSESAHNINVRY